MRIGIISDTHGLLREEVYQGLKECDYICHAGDIGDMAIIKELEKICPVYVVRGNNDIGRLYKDIPEEVTFNIHSFKFYMLHDIKDLSANKTDIDFIIYGHSHQFNYEYNDEFHTHRINPGSCGKKRFSLPLTYAILHLQSGHIKLEGFDLSDHKVEVYDLN